MKASFFAPDGKGRRERQTKKVFSSDKVPKNKHFTSYDQQERIKQALSSEEGHHLKISAVCLSSGEVLHRKNSSVCLYRLSFPSVAINSFPFLPPPAPLDINTDLNTDKPTKFADRKPSPSRSPPPEKLFRLPLQSVFPVRGQQNLSLLSATRSARPKYRPEPERFQTAPHTKAGNCSDHP
jgi:hypothetical protein